MATCAVSGTVQDISGTAIASAVIKANVITPAFSGLNQILPMEISTTSSALGAWTLNLVQGTQAMITIEYQPNSTNSRRPITYAITVPATTTADFSTLATEL